MKLKSVLAHTLAVFLVSMFSLPTLAQNFRGQVRGLVSETSGAVVRSCRPCCVGKVAGAGRLCQVWRSSGAGIS